MSLKFIELFSPASPEVRTPKKEGGKPYTCLALQGMAETEDGRKEVFADLMFAPRGPDGKQKTLPTVPAGKYIPKFASEVDFQTRRLVARLVGLSPYSAA